MNDRTISILERDPKVRILRNPCAPWLTITTNQPTHIDSPRLTRDDLL